MKATLTLTATLFSIWTAIAIIQQPRDLQRHFPDFEGSFILYDQAENRYVRHNPTRCARRFSPCSTFKIAHSLIALDTGVATDAHFRQEWDAKRYPREPWMSDGLAKSWLKDHTLRTAFQNSAVWYYRELAKRIGKQRMQMYLDRFGYGNADISGGIDQFWLDKSLLISPEEQIQFLKAFYHNRFGLSDSAVLLVKDIMLIEQNAHHRLSAKTGTNLRGMGWVVGFVETGDNVYFFAYNAQLPADKRHPKQRIDMVKAILTELGVLA